ncbi:MAG: tetratricopeptide repeat protein, partial [Bryobacterales bacterium]|nr:tetratricopeptide repeat protein [Bryobacterales bacterium]
MKNASDLLKAGKLSEAIQAVIQTVRDHPTDDKARTFLFELLCFAGEYDRAEKHLDALLENKTETLHGSLLYKAALHAQRTRENFYAAGEYKNSSADSAPAVGATINGKHYASVRDADPRIGARLEVFAGGSFMWIPFRHLERVDIEKPRRLRDLLWLPSKVVNASTFTEELGDVLLPVITAEATRDESETVKLGRETYFGVDEDGLEIPVGQKLLLADDEEIPLLEVRELVFVPPV